MKKAIFLLLLTFAAFPVFSQDVQDAVENGNESKSTAAAFSAKSGILLKKEFNPLGKVKNIEVDVITYTDITTNEVQKCVRLKTSKMVKMGQYEEYNGTLDADELDACIKSLTYIQENLLNTSPQLYTECTYLSRDHVKLAAFYSKKKWVILIAPRSYKSASSSYIEPSELNDLVEKLKEAKELVTQ